VLKGRDAEAIEVLCALNDTTEDDPKIQNEFKAVKDTVFEMAQGSFADCFKLNRNRNFHRTALAYVNQMFQQISGINVRRGILRLLSLKLTPGRSSRIMPPPFSRTTLASPHSLAVSSQH
jgi:hypothetical protein